jgi:hypothetical protein
MKQLLTIPFIFLLNTTIFAQDTLNNRSKFIIKADILSPILSISKDLKMGSLTAELGFKKCHSIQVMGSYKVDTHLGPSEKTLQIIPMYKFFLFKKKFCDGLYSGVNANYTQGNFPSDKIIHNTNVWYRHNSLGGGLIIGYQTYIKKHLVVDALIAAGMEELINAKEIVGNVKFDDKITNAQNPNFYLILALNIGYKF